jgi:type IV pilus assembly protein PilA
MKFFCTHCGASLEVATPQAQVLCTQCGKASILQAPPAAGAPIPPAKKGISTAVIVAGLAVACLGLPCFAGCLAAIAIPNFIRYQARSKQAEVKSNLRMLFTAEKSLFEEEHRYTTDLDELSFSVEGANRYAYFADVHGTLRDPGVHATRGSAGASAIGVDRKRYPDQTRVQVTDVIRPGVPAPGLTGACPSCEITLVAAGNIDADPTLDVWSISSADRTATSGATIPAGTLHQDVDDLRD